MSANASELFREMYSAIRQGRRRTTASPVRPGEVLEAPPMSVFKLDTIHWNVPDCRKLNVPWAVANVLHFFADTEAAGCLRRYNKHADRFLTGDGWLGAYGRVFKRQLYGCIAALRGDPSTRRAVCTAGRADELMDANRPCCWSTLHFLHNGEALDLLVYQRSLDLFNVAPYDLILLTNILEYVAARCEVQAGSLRWAVGSLHCSSDATMEPTGLPRHSALYLPEELLRDRCLCYAILEDPAASPYPRIHELMEGDEL